MRGQKVQHGIRLVHVLAQIAKVLTDYATAAWDRRRRSPGQRPLAGKFRGDADRRLLAEGV